MDNFERYFRELTFAVQTGQVKKIISLLIIGLVKLVKLIIQLIYKLFGYAIVVLFSVFVVIFFAYFVPVFLTRWLIGEYDAEERTRNTLQILITGLILAIAYISIYALGINRLSWPMIPVVNSVWGFLYSYITTLKTSLVNTVLITWATMSLLFLISYIMTFIPEVIDRMSTGAIKLAQWPLKMEKEWDENPKGKQT